MSFSRELAEVLGEQLEVLKALEAIAYDKTDIIIEDDVEALERLTKKEEGLINRLGMVEEKRIKLLDSWGLNMDISMSHILDGVPDGKEELLELQIALMEVLSHIQERNDLNRELIEDNLQWLDFNMNLISNVQSSTTYGKGNDDEKIGDSLFDRKV
ncbi:MAG: flagellar protein FlgN [Tissierellia bacterium]|nr:flagellar protein FlgN [Tissierellia bacterium]